MSTQVIEDEDLEVPIFDKTDQRRVAMATMVGTAVEWYDYFIYATAAGLVFGQLFFKDAGPTLATILSFFSVGISFLFRPLGAFIAGHMGDQIGRRPMLVITLVTMGAATTLIGCLPTYDKWGLMAPVLLLTLRIAQGISAGGEWGGAALMAVEHAPANKRGFYGAMPQLGVPLGLLMSSAMLALMNILFPGDKFLQWGWRIPFLFSFVLIIVGFWIRHRVEESPVFTEISERKMHTKLPAAKLLRFYFPLVLLAALVFAGNSASGYMTTGGYIQHYATSSAIGLARGTVLWASTVAGVTWGVSTLLGGWLSDKIGQRNVYLTGWVVQGAGLVALFPLVNTKAAGNLFMALVFLTIGLGLTYGPQASWYAELFPASVRFSGVSISYAFGSILGGAFAPMIAAALLNSTGTTRAITFYLLGMAVLGAIATLMLRDRRSINLSPTAELEQRHNIYVWQHPDKPTGQ